MILTESWIVSNEDYSQKYDYLQENDYLVLWNDY